MCGIAGFIGANLSAEQARAALSRMNAAQRHRGPDDDGAFVDVGAGVGLGHRRLSIIDLSPSGHQPMCSHSGRYAFVYNGEIFNADALRAELDATARRAWRGHSDTEVMLEAIEAWGLERAVGRFIGMFAFALWDRREQCLHLVRDRLGIKPLAYGRAAGTFVFASDLRAIAAFPGFSNPVDRDAVALFLRYNYMPAPLTIRQGICKLPPGHILSLDLAAAKVGGAPRLACYWSARAVAEAGAAQPLADANEAVEAFDRLLADAVRRRMVADVPLGAFLSGGVDSSTVVALMQAQHGSRVRTFSIGYEDPAYDEAADARRVAAAIGTDHTDLYVSPRMALDVVPLLGGIHDEPFADPAQIPTYLVAKLARSQVAVTLSGDGGDEVFGGYVRHLWGSRIWRAFGWMPPPVRRGVAGAMTALPPEGWDRIAGIVEPLLPRRLRQRLPGDKMHKMANAMLASGPEDMLRRIVSHWHEPGALVPGSVERPTCLVDPQAWPRIPAFEARMMHMDLVSFLPDNVLANVDRATMAVSLEGRVPLIDHRVVELAARLPVGLRIRDGIGKWVLRQVLYRYVDRRLVDRPKMGFGVPIAAWLRGELRDWASGLLEPGRLRAEGFIEPAPVTQRWQEHLSGRRDHAQALWNVLMFQAWLQQQPAGTVAA